MESVLFYLFGAMALATAIYVVSARNPLHGAMGLIGTFFALAATYVLLGAHFLAVLQLLVYAGAIMVLFVFVIMLLNLKDEELGGRRVTPAKIAAGGALGLTGLVLAVRVFGPLAPTADLASEPGFGTVKAVGRVLYGPYLLSFEATSLLLLVAIVAAVVVARVRI